MAGDQASTSKVQKLVTANFARLNPSSVKFHGRMRCKIKGITFRLNETCDQAAKLGLQRVPQGPSTNLWRRTPSTCLPIGAGIFGRDEDKKKILELVLQKAGSQDANFDVLELLLEDGIWSVFLKHALKDDDDGENLGLVRKKVVQKCCGLPLAARHLEELGGEYFRELVSKSIFQVSANDRSLHVMNDLVNDLARWAAGETYFGPEDEVEAHLQPERSRHSSYTRDDYDGIKKFEAFHKAKCLRTFLPFRHGETSYVTNNIVGLLPNLKGLRVLSLSGYNISELPDSIGELKLLRYLDLSSTMIRSLPESTGSLYNLQTLILRDCSYLTKWPSKMGEL
ncbi:hypothetical protein OIU79_009325 [Salix purpurea]|uniref:NB-ARC domain-containing protein n=1 Tax=Salix purpurea TaxID=77065 RepID=A0A9Q0YX28_SALPP|nr:hypothetical protein OIU79_009325 [Salix purpurea]